MRHTLSLSPGSRLGPFTIVSALGAGGMGEVYRARDTRLDRDVAIKILPDAFSTDAERLTRFEREAKTLASLNHPHIAHVHGLEESGGTRALVMELVEGEDLSARIARGPIPLDEALPIARQIADALGAAHERGIIHRDLKPANVKVSADGAVKVLDFGLAKAMEKAAQGGDAVNSPTITSPATQLGMILGTAAYMSPEQAKGRIVDRRADVWAFGVVLLEMLTGRRAFPGDDVSDVLASVLKDTPPLDSLPLGTPPAIRRLLRRCLEKDRAKRLDSVVAARLEIEDALSGAGADLPAAAASVARPSPLWLRLTPWLIAAAAVAVAFALAGRRASAPAAAALVASLEAPAGYVLGEDDALTSLPTRVPFVFTPDGRSLIVQAARDGRPQLFLRSLDQAEPRPIAGTDGARAPFVSPEGKWIGYWTANELRKVPIEGGAPSTICGLPATLGPNGASWGSNDVIVYGDDASARLMRVPAGGGTPAPVTPAAHGFNRRAVTPLVMPDGKRVLYAEVNTLDMTDSRVRVIDIDGGEPRTLVEQGTDPRLLPSGQLAFIRSGTLMVVPFDAARAELTGQPVAVMQRVMQSGLRGRFGATNTGAGMYAVSRQGTLAAIRGDVLSADPATLIWATPGGELTPAEPPSGAPAGSRLWAQLSPDGTRAVVRVTATMEYQVWIVDWTRGVWTRCAECPTAVGAVVWSPDGRRLLSSSDNALIVRTLDGAVPDRTLVKEEGRTLTPTDWLRDGRIVYASSPDAARFEINVLDPGASAGRLILPAGMASEPDVSPDGRWIAYTSAQTGVREVFAQAFARPGSRIQISGGGGRNPAWSPDGKTIFYLDNTPAGQTGSRLFAVSLGAEPDGTVRPGTPRQILSHPDGQGCIFARCFDVAADGRFLLRDRNADNRKTVSRIDLVVNWSGTLPTSGSR